LNAKSCEDAWGMGFDCMSNETLNVASSGSANLISGVNTIHFDSSVLDDTKTYILYMSIDDSTNGNYGRTYYSELTYNSSSGGSISTDTHLMYKHGSMWNVNDNGRYIATNLGDITSISVASVEGNISKPTGSTIKVFGLNNVEKTTGSLASGDYVQVTAEDGTTTRIYKLYGIRPQAVGGDGYSLILTDTGKVYSFGANGNGQLGLGDTDNRTVPTQILVAGEGNITSIAGYGQFNYLLDKEGNVYSFGWNGDGSLGHGDMDNRNTPTKIATLSNIVSVSAGNSFALFLDKAGKVYSVGVGDHGRLGDGNAATHTVSTPQQITAVGEGNITAISAVSESHGVLLDKNGKVYVFGNGSFGRLGDGNNADHSVTIPTQLLAAGENNISAIATSNKETYLIGKDGKLYGFGENSNNQLGIANKQLLPKLITDVGENNVTTLATALGHTLMIGEDGKVYGFGSNWFGALGLGSTLPGNAWSPLSLISLLGENNITSIAVGNEHSIVIDKEGRFYSFGWNNNGQLGVCDTNDKNVPVLLNSSTCPFVGAVVADTTVPTIDITANINNIYNTSARLNTSIDESGTIYYIVVPNNATAPNTAQVKAGVTYGGVSIINTGSKTTNTAPFDVNISLSGLSASTEYDLYMYATDLADNNTSVTKIDFTTTNQAFPSIAEENINFIASYGAIRYGAGYVGRNNNGTDDSPNVYDRGNVPADGTPTSVVECNGGYRMNSILCDDSRGTPDTTNHKYKNFKSSAGVGITWSESGENSSGYIVIDLQANRSFNFLSVFQMFSDGKVTNAKMYASSEYGDEWPTRSDNSWTTIVDKTAIGTGLGSSNNNSFTTCPTAFQFDTVSARYIMLEFWNDGTHGNDGYIEVGGVKLFYEPTPSSPESGCPTNISMITPPTYTVTFNSNGGSSVTGATINHNATASTPTQPTKSGYTFGGWYSESGLTNSFIFTTPITANTTLYAKWNAVLNGTCGTSNNTTNLTTAPTTNLCSAGTPTSVLGNSTTYTWSCNGANSGTNASCSALKVVLTDTNTTEDNSTEDNTDNNTSNGNTDNNSSNNENSPLNGTCGKSHTTTSKLAPTINLCSIGTATTPTLSSGIFGWSCSGSNGGVTIDCNSTQSIEDATEGNNTIISGLIGTTKTTDVNGTKKLDVNTTNENNQTIVIQAELPSDPTSGVKTKHKVTIGGKETVAISKLEATVDIKSDKSVETKASKDTTDIVVTAKPDGTAEHTVKKDGIESKATSKIVGANTQIDENGTVETMAGDVNTTQNGVTYTIKAVAETKADGKTITKFVKVNVADETDVELIGNTVLPTTPFEAGTNVIIDNIGGTLYIKTSAPLDENLVIE